MPSPPAAICIRGARAHNLENVDLTLPSAGLTVLVGPSGSGKSSLALDVLHAASRARLSGLLGGPVSGGARVDVDEIRPLPLTMALSDRSRPPASARVIDLLGLTGPLVNFAMAFGCMRCPRCHRALPTATSDEIVAALLARASGQRLTLLAPVARGRVGGVSELIAEIGRYGFARVRLDGVLHRIEELPSVDARLAHDLDVVVDRLRLSDDRAERLEEAVGTTLTAGSGRLLALIDDTEHSHCERPWCPDHPEQELDAVQAAWLAGGPGDRCRACLGEGSLEGSPCDRCAGSGLRHEVAHWTLDQGACTWPELLELELHELPGRIGKPAALDPNAQLWERVHGLARLADIPQVDHLPGNRRVDALSSTELRRLRLAAAFSTRADLPGVVLVLDEPLAGLDSETAASLDRLFDVDDPTLVVTHDRSLVDRARHCVAFGPGAGRRGGTVVWQGPGRDLPHALLPPAPSIDPPVAAPGDLPAILLRGARGKVLGASTPGRPSGGIDARFPHGRLTVVTGPAGSGKSALVLDTLLPAARLALELVAEEPLDHDAVSGLEPFTQLLSFDRSPLGRSSRSCVATVLGLWSPLRELLAATRDARILGFDAQRFRFDQAGGRCEACQGSGLLQLDSVGAFDAADRSEPCPVCSGNRFQRDTLRVRLKGRTVAELLHTDVEDAQQLFAVHRKLGPALTAAKLVGLGYLPLGQASATLSGGEAQRLRLARELARAGGIGFRDPRRLDDRLLILDSPTVGLHPHDVRAVVEVLRRLADRGATVVVATVDPLMIGAADYGIQLRKLPPRRSSP